MAAIKAIVFDLDGTLIDSIPAVAAAVNRLLEEQGRRPLGVKETKTMVGWGAGITIEKAFEATGAPLAPIDLPEALERYLDFYLADPAGHTGKAGSMARLGTSPIVKNSGLTHFGPRSGRQIMRLLFHRTGQEPLSHFLHHFST